MDQETIAENKEFMRLLLAATIPPILGVLFVYIASSVLSNYGWTMFFGLPVFMGFVSTVIFSPTGDKSLLKCFLVSFLSLLTIAVLLLIFAIEGLICLAMTLPLAIPLTALGAAIAYVITNARSKRTSTTISVILVAAMPLLLGFENSTKSKPTLHQVVSTVEINAPIEDVWKNVVAFPQIDKQPEGILNLGFAYPINARIEGSGVGAIRYCNFNTGPFVEPITAWQEPTLLAFDVTEQPSPMTELSPYEHLHTAHLEYIRSQKGQFRLYEKDGKTVVEGTTFYTHDIAPDIYWNLYSEEIIHQIHLRVLNHIKEVSEK